MTARDRATSAIAALPAVGLDALTTEAALLTRVDRKYVVPMDAAASLLHDLQRSVDAPAALEIEGERELAYRSVYFDTPDLLSFRLAAHGRRRRFKLRTRTYLDTGAAFLEMKTRGARGLTRKDRDAYDLDAADRLTAEARDDVAEALGAIGVEPAAPTTSTRDCRPCTAAPRCCFPGRSPLAPRSTSTCDGSPPTAEASLCRASRSSRRSRRARRAPSTAPSGARATVRSASASTPPVWRRCAPTSPATAGPGCSRAPSPHRHPSPPPAPRARKDTPCAAA